MKYKEAKSLALESLLSNLKKSESDLITSDLLEQIVEIAWEHQAQEEPRNEVRTKLRDLVDSVHDESGQGD
jgi:hypothetical protein